MGIKITSHLSCYHFELNGLSSIQTLNSGEASVCRLVKSPYAGFDVVGVDPGLYADVSADEPIDGLPTLPRLGKGILRGL